MTCPAAQWLQAFTALLAPAIGGALVLVAGWLADRRRDNKQRLDEHARERALLTGAFAVANYLKRSINDFNSDGSYVHHSRRLKIANSHLEKILNGAHQSTESVMLTVFDVGIHLSSYISLIDSRPPDERAVSIDWIKSLAHEQNELIAALEGFDLIADASLTTLSEEDIERMSEN